MTAEEASEAANAMKVDVVVPMHIGAIIGSRTEAERFKRLEGSKSVVQILEKE
jgi:L-ascorbate metabolism protein UlaG (beta-lactamase superfamily)